LKVDLILSNLYLIERNYTLLAIISPAPKPVVVVLLTLLVTTLFIPEAAVVVPIRATFDVITLKVIPVLEPREIVLHLLPEIILLVLTPVFVESIEISLLTELSDMVDPLEVNAMKTELHLLFPTVELDTLPSNSILLTLLELTFEMVTAPTN